MCPHWKIINHPAVCYLAGPGARRPSLSSCFPGCQPDTGTWQSLEAGHGWPAVTRRAVQPGESRGQRPQVGPLCSSASGWWAWGHLRPHIAWGPCHQGTRTQTQWGWSPLMDLGNKMDGNYNIHIFTLCPIPPKGCLTLRPTWNLVLNKYYYLYLSTFPHSAYRCTMSKC